MDNILRMLGIAKKAGKLELGEEPVGAVSRARTCRLILIAQDAADNTLRRAAHFSQFGNIPRLTVPYTKAALGQAVGRSSLALLAVTDVGLAEAIAQKLSAAYDTAAYRETAALLAEKTARVRKRQAEKRIHTKKKRNKETR
ncbi:MAG: L7Ae/L30e/S12e/Gadd45 family ribosomal protein [Oscillospiraceae bacterium]|jgi:ribosomal protein L7Ae-like RNA K-turn-binding protein